MGLTPLNCAQIVVFVLVHLAEPERGLARGLQHIVQLGRLGQPVAVEIDGAGVMLAALGVQTSRRG